MSHHSSFRRGQASGRPVGSPTLLAARALLLVSTLVPALLLSACDQSAADPAARPPVIPSLSSADSFTLPVPVFCETLRRLLTNTKNVTTEDQKTEVNPVALAEVVRRALASFQDVAHAAGDSSEIHLDSEFQKACPDVRQEALTALGKQSLDDA